jgi:5,10-methylene-tetrahydrofolate dehydrogenase/methenyl tetrahydrofolate cyclohydrolase
MPGLCVIIVGNRDDSLLYVNMKKKICNEIGINSKSIQLDENVTTENIIGVINVFNTDSSIHGILIQLPLPKHIDENAVLTAVNINKDVDGFHAVNIGNLALAGREPLFTPCTPLGCMRLLDSYDIDIQGKTAVVIGKSNIVGLPVSLLLMKKNATVTVCHVYTKNLKDICQNADIIVSACGQAEMIKGDWIKDGVVIIDIGINHTIDSNNPDKKKIVGDVDFQECEKKASYITPVPGGVGPMTISMLMENTYRAYCKFNNFTF